MNRTDIDEMNRQYEADKANKNSKFSSGMKVRVDKLIIP